MHFYERSSFAFRFVIFFMFTTCNYTGMIDNEVVVRIAQKIRATRLRKNLTIQQVATRTNVSQGLLSKIENVKTVPSLPVFLALIQSLHIPLNDFFQDMILDNRRDYLLVKKEQHSQQKKNGRSDFHYLHILSRNVPNCTMEARLLTLAAGARARGRTTTTVGFEFRYILSGTCECQINNELIVLEQGDSLCLDATVPHNPINKTRKEVQMLVIHFAHPK